MTTEPSGTQPTQPQPGGRRATLALAGVLLFVLLLVLVLPKVLSTPPVTPVPKTAVSLSPSLAATLSPSLSASTPVTGTLPVQVPTASGRLPLGQQTAAPQAQQTTASQATVNGTNTLLPSAQPSVQAEGILTGTAVLAPTPGARTPDQTSSGLTVVGSSGPAYLCHHSQGCADSAAVNMPLPSGGEARTGPGGMLLLQTPAGLLTLAPESAVRVTGANNQQTRITLDSGRVLARSAPGRQSPFIISAGLVTVDGTGSTFSVSSRSVTLPGTAGPQTDIRVSVPADAARSVHVTSPSTAVRIDVQPGSQVDLLPTGAPTSGPLSGDEAAALAALGPAAPVSTAAPAAITELPVPSVPPLPSGVVTATIVLTQRPDETKVPVTVPPHGETSATPAAGIASLPLPSETAPATAAQGVTPNVSDLFAASVKAMGAMPSYNFGATKGADPATAEFSAGSLSGDSACWTVTANSGRTDYQVLGGSLFTRPGSGPWQQQAAGLPDWLSEWKLLGKIDPATASDLGTSQLDAVTVHHLRAHTSDSSQGGDTWLDAFVGADDHLIRSLILYAGDPKANRPIFKMGFSSLGDAPACPPLSGP